MDRPVFHMTNNVQFSGECELRIRPAAEIASPDWAVLTARWDAWITAINAGMFPPGQIAAAPDKFAPEGAGLTFQSIPAVAFGVLNGMLSQFSVGWVHLDGWSLRDRRTGVNLLSTDATFPGPPPGKIALPLGIDPNSRGENISIVIEFADSIDASSRETIVRTLEAWKELLNGGYPFHASSGSPWSTGDPLEETGVVGSVRFLDPSTAVIHLEFVRAAPESTTPLIHLLYSWRDRFPIDRAYVES
jgi:hypothetical protein